MTDIFDAILKNDLNDIKDMLSIEPSIVDTYDKEGNFPIHCAVLYGDLEVCKVLLENGSHPDSINSLVYFFSKGKHLFTWLLQLESII